MTSTDLIRYDLLAQEALRGLVRKVLSDTARYGLPGEHHFFITFDTRAAGVKLSNRLREKYPESMTIVIQYQFRDLKVSDTGFEIGLTFGGVPERLLVPYAAITDFVDPSVKFGLKFEVLIAESESEADSAQSSATDDLGLSSDAPETGKGAKAAAKEKAEKPEKPAIESPEHNVVRFDTFRKK